MVKQRKTNDLNFITTRYGKFWPLAPKAKDIDVRAIAYGLAGQYRYAGHSRLTVAQHSVVGSYYCENALAFLLHDSMEGLGFGDLTRIIKHAPGMKYYRNREIDSLAIVLCKFGLPPNLPATVKQVDETMWQAEMKILFGREPKRGETILPLTADQSRLWPPDEAERRFLARYAELTGNTISVRPDETVMFSLPAQFVQPNVTCRLEGISTPAVAAARLISTPSLPPRPPNSFTRSEYMKENGVAQSTATTALRRLADAGKIRSVRFKVASVDGRVETRTGWQLVEDTK
jgi:hypothetical protein